MILTLDIGNTRSKFAVFDDMGTIKSYGVIEEISDQETVETIAACRIGVFTCVRAETPDLSGFGCEMIELSAPVWMEKGYSNSSQKDALWLDFETPEQLGADRLAAALGAVNKYVQADEWLVIDAGTCVTYEWLRRLESGATQYYGGSISPGLQMRYKAMHQFTGLLPLLSHEGLPLPFFQSQEQDLQAGRNTHEAMGQGAQAGLVFEVEGYIERFRAQSPNGVVILTGGDATFLAERLKTEIFVEPLLTHYGLWAAAIRNATHQ